MATAKGIPTEISSINTHIYYKIVHIQTDTLPIEVYMKMELYKPIQISFDTNRPPVPIRPPTIIDFLAAEDFDIK